MAIQTIYDTGSSYNIPSSYDGGLYDSAVNTDCVVRGVGDEFTLNSNGTSLNVSFAGGSEAVIGGSFFKLTADTSITLQGNSSIYLCATIDLTRPNGSRGTFTQKTQASISKGNLNGSGSSRDLPLYLVTTNASGVTNVTDLRHFADKHIALTEAEYNALENKEKDTFYYIVE